MSETSLKSGLRLMLWQQMTHECKQHAAPHYARKTVAMFTRDLSLYHNCDSTTIRLRHDYDENLTC